MFFIFLNYILSRNVLVLYILDESFFIFLNYLLLRNILISYIFSQFFFIFLDYFLLRNVLILYISMISFFILFNYFLWRIILKTIIFILNYFLSRILNNLILMRQHVLFFRSWKIIQINIFVKIQLWLFHFYFNQLCILNFVFFSFLIVKNFELLVPIPCLLNSSNSLFLIVYPLSSNFLSLKWQFLFSLATLK